MPKETYIPCLLRLFRQYGYDGATLSKISEATGLGKASLYHHFPGGKDEMVKTVLDYIEQWLAKNILPTLHSEGDALSRLQCMCDRLNELYEGGQQPCLFAILLLGSARDVFHNQVKAVLHTWIDAIAGVLIEAGINQKLAHHRGEDAAIMIQGALILSQGLDDPSVFQRVIQRLPEDLCRIEYSREQEQA
ncbi:TetR/AcrR family transcriptional regulator [Nostoc sp. CENA67]|uniref:TetR/AcrR family transcriptional regulator n=1 Tax=Amazonocrinis nigriterrae CENA67 TaxID=2794033 RepID=A0A8J7HWZ7_9NOST|nr:TetR/AcrR family transcriptional regulator [Amazonocrinis nigriterrae]MBH8563894.1 TetR/AcrR family transcriptional regulator [Amazonocrinis nigriterrae CENA67]